MFDNITFFNFFHNGDIHLSRTFVDRISKYLLRNGFCKKVYYHHRNDNRLLNDIEHVEYTTIPPKCREGTLMHIPDLQPNKLYLNTWYASDNHKFMNQYGISFDCLYSLFERHFQYLTGESLDIFGEPEYFFPKIDYSKFYIENIDNKIKDYNKRILISNGNTLSGQCSNFSLINSVKKLANKYNDILFILTNVEGSIDISKHENIMYSVDIIAKPSGSDLNENAYLGSKCGINIGRASGVHTYCLNQDILFNQNYQYISYSNLGYNEGSFWLSSRFSDKIEYSANVVSKDLLNTYQFESDLESAIGII